jgi:hypothetical protein
MALSTLTQKKPELPLRLVRLAPRLKTSIRLVNLALLVGCKPYIIYSELLAINPITSGQYQ